MINSVFFKFLVIKIVCVLPILGNDISIFAAFSNASHHWRHKRSEQENDVNILNDETERILAEHPYTVSISLLSKHWCSGAILSPSWVLSAAQCFDYAKIEDLLVRAGTAYSISGGQVSSVVTVERHPTYRMDLYYPEHSLAMLKIATPFIFNKLTRHVGLPPEKAELAVKDDELIVTGYGNDFEENDPLTKQERCEKGPIRRFRVRTTPTSKCRVLYSQEYYLQYDNFCLLSDGENLCTGDTGNPAVAYTEADPLGVVYGIAVYAGSQRPCSKRTNPGIYVKVSYSRKWIDRIIEQSGDEIPEVVFTDSTETNNSTEQNSEQTTKVEEETNDDLIDEHEDNQGEELNKNKIDLLEDSSTERVAKSIADEKDKEDEGDKLQLIQIPSIPAFKTNFSDFGQSLEEEEEEDYDHTLENDEKDDREVTDNHLKEEIVKKISEVKKVIDKTLQKPFTTEAVTVKTTPTLPEDDQLITTEASYEDDYDEEEENE